MPAAKHSSPISPARLIFLSAVIILVALVVWVAVRAVGPSRDEAARPTVVLPSMPTIPVASALPSPASPSPSLSPSPSRTPSHSPSARRSASPSPRVSRSSASPRPPAASASFSATVSSNASWDQGYVGMVQVVNKGTKTASWSVSVSHSGLTGLRLGGTWNAQGHQSGTTFIFTGGSLDPGKSASFGYQASKQGAGRARPAGCTVTGGTCHVS